ncbi:MAG: ATP-binding protein [Bdellovibrionales bacterium]|nr:ATP-binding protein [Bdellovibrionales bacterium]
MVKIIDRKKYLNEIRTSLSEFPVTALIGPRQCGKTTLAKQIMADHYFDLENPRDSARLSEPQLTLEQLVGVVVIDEIQMRPDIFPLLRYLVDQDQERRFLILGSASPTLIKESSESLAGRIGIIEIAPFSSVEVDLSIELLWLRGGFPGSLLAHSNEASVRWRSNYIRTFLERDIPQLGITLAASTLRRFWIMLSHYHGQILNISELGRSFGISEVTARNYIAILEGTFMVDLLQPWHANISKRQVKRPKLYLRDSGLFHSLQSIDSRNALLENPKLGASFEGFAVQELLRIAPIRRQDFFFWNVHAGSEIDLFWRCRGKAFGLEVKYKNAPKKERSMDIALKDLELEHLWVVYPGDVKYALSESISVVPVGELSTCFE